MSLSHVDSERAEHPVDVVERMASVNEWPFDREQDDEISMSVAGGWTDYHVAFTWLPDVEALHLGCALDVKVPDRRRNEVLRLVGLINEQLWVGHFGLWDQEGVVIYRHAMLLTDGTAPKRRQCEAALNAAVAACERYYQAFQFVLWAGKTAPEALETAMFETMGEA